MELDRLLHIEEDIQHLIRRTGQFAKEEFLRFTFDKVEFKGAKDPVSFVDVTAEKMLKEGCARLLPGSGFVNEESENQASGNGYSWIIDPIDGTTNFTHGVPHFSISLGLQYEEEMVMGYIYAPMTGEMFAAIKGKGASLNGKPIHVSERPVLGEALIGTGFPYSSTQDRETFLQLLVDVMDAGHGMRRLGSAALDLAYVAAGRLDAFYEYELSPWDVAAGELIVREAGGKVSDFSGGDDYLYGRQIIATNGKIHEELRSIIRNRMLHL